MTYAVVETGGKQYRVGAGDIIDVELLDAAADETVTFDRVLAVRSDEDLAVGTPLVDGARAVATVLGEVKGEKIRIFKYRAKTNYRKRQGHRQRYTRVRIDAIELD